MTVSPGNHASINMDAFSDGQMASKLWLCEELEKKFALIETLWIYGSWYGLLAYLFLAREKIKIKKIVLFEIDPAALEISKKILFHWGYRHKVVLDFVLHDCQTYPQREETPSLIINTSVEHFPSWDWWKQIPWGTQFALQATDMDHVEHVSRVHSLEEMKEKMGPGAQLSFEGVLNFDYGHLRFQRFMCLGTKK